MALVSGLGGSHSGATFLGKRVSIIAQQENVKDCSCTNLKPNRRKKRSKTVLLKKRMKQYNIWFYEIEVQKQVDYTRRRLERNKKRKLLTKTRGARALHWLYVFDAIFWVFGVAFTLCSTIKAVGEDTYIYKNKALFVPLGSGILLVAVLFLFIGTALKHQIYSKLAKPTRRAVRITQKNKKKSESDLNIEGPDNDSEHEEDNEKIMLKLQREKYFESIEDDIGVINGEETMTPNNDTKSFSSEWPNVVVYRDGDTDTERYQNRRALAKSRWIRRESFDNDEVLDLSRNANIGEFRNVPDESRETIC